MNIYPFELKQKKTAPESLDIFRELTTKGLGFESLKAPDKKWLVRSIYTLQP